MDIYYFGPQGTFTHQAAMEFSKLYQWHDARLIAVPTISEALGMIQNAIQREKSAYACIPLENSIQGSVTASWDNLGHKAPLSFPSPRIVSAVRLPIQHNLLVKDKSVPLTELQTVYSHPQALAQCRNWLGQYLPQAAPVSAESTAAAAQSVAKNVGNSVAAIGALAAAKHYSLDVVRESIEDVKNNTTRFGLVGDPVLFDTQAGRPAANRIRPAKQTLSLLLTQVNNSPGGLSKVLAPFSEAHFNLNRIESRPVGTHLGTYVFYVDVEWDSSHSEENWFTVEEVLNDLGVEVKVLGQFSEW